jgi:hypothetical protein
MVSTVSQFQITSSYYPFAPENVLWKQSPGVQTRKLIDITPETGAKVGIMGNLIVNESFNSVHYESEN